MAKGARKRRRIHVEETALFKELEAQRLVALFVGGWLLFNFPLLGLWDRAATLFGVALFPAVLFFLWGLVIATMAWLMERPGSPQPDD